MIAPAESRSAVVVVAEAVVVAPAVAVAPEVAAAVAVAVAAALVAASIVVAAHFGPVPIVVAEPYSAQILRLPSFSSLFLTT